MADRKGTLRVEYGGVLSPRLLDYLTEAKDEDLEDLEVAGRRPLVIRTAEVDRVLLRVLPFLGDPAMRVGGILLRRAAPGI